MLLLKPIVIDSSVLFDMIFVNSLRHEVAKKLHRKLKQKSVMLRTPFHAFFELHAAIKQERLKGPGYLSDELTEDNGIQLFPEPIDEKFLNTALNLTLPYIKGSDFIFLCFAARDQLPLLTEDVKLRIKAEEAYFRD